MFKTLTPDEEKASWVNWLNRYGADKFYDSFMRHAQYARSRCKHCGQDIYLDIVEGGGVADWGSAFWPGKPGLDFGCVESPDTCEEGTGSHEPERL